MSILPDFPVAPQLNQVRANFEELTESFFQDCRDRGIASNTMRTYKYHLHDFFRFLEKKPAEQVNREDLKAYLDGLRARGVSKTTASYHFNTLGALYDYLLFENRIASNPIVPIRKRYLQGYKLDGQSHTHQIISVEEAAQLIEAIVDIRDRALVMLLFKTGVRRKELISMDVDDINWRNQSILLKPTAKRTNRLVFFDDEAEDLLRRWLNAREMRAKSGEPALWIGTRGRMGASGIDRIIHLAAVRACLHDSESPDMEDHFSAHSCRHWFTTHLRRAGMTREFIQELRGDVRREAIDIYDHIDKEELRRSYLAHMPQLGV